MRIDLHKQPTDISDSAVYYVNLMNIKTGLRTGLLEPLFILIALFRSSSVPLTAQTSPVLITFSLTLRSLSFVLVTSSLKFSLALRLNCRFVFPQASLAHLRFRFELLFISVRLSEKRRKSR